MLSSSPRDYQTNFSEDPSVETRANASQHGQPDHLRRAPPSSFGTEGALLNGNPSPSSGSSPELQVLVEEVQGRRLKASQTPPRNRISAYERASIPVLERWNNGPVFRVVRKPRQPFDKRAPFAEFPNELLNHIFSHLSASDLSTVALVSRQFHDLVTKPHAWKAAFARFFPGQDSLLDNVPSEKEDGGQHSEKRAFTRLAALPSWRSEYVLRTQLLRSLSRGKPVHTISSPSSARSGTAHTANASVMYNSQLFTTVNHLHATFGTGLNKKLPRFIHGADDVGTVSSSDPASGKVDNWGLADPLSFLQFYERFPGEAQWGLGAGDIVGNPNVLDVSQPYGMVHGDGFPAGLVYYRSVDEMRGRSLPPCLGLGVPKLGIPRVPTDREGICSLWIAKNPGIPTMTGGLIGFLAGSSKGILTGYSLGTDGARDHRLARGELTSRWVLSPGVPLIAVAVDESYSLRRHAQNRIWAVVLNALGEVFYLTQFPSRASESRSPTMTEEEREVLAWTTGRSVCWNFVELSRRIAKLDPYNTGGVDGSYSPRSSWRGMCLNPEQIAAETQEIETFLAKTPKDFRKTCEGWDMRRRLEVDFGGDDGNHAGEAVLVIECGLEEAQLSAVTRYTRCRIPQEAESHDFALGHVSNPDSEPPSLFGGSTITDQGLSGVSTPSRSPPNQGMLQRRVSAASIGNHSVLIEQWRLSRLSLEPLRNVQITASALDMSSYALLTKSEDPAFMSAGRSDTSDSSSIASTPTDLDDDVRTRIPGQRARLMAIGTAKGTVIIWDIRSPVSRSAELANRVHPLRVIYTSSPSISSLAMSALTIVVGGNDGLVQFWDPLASNTQPIRTLNSRFSSRARRRLVQAQASPQGVGINLFAAGAICLDPDPTVLRGMVSIGTHLLYWSYSASAAEQYKRSKRNLRRSERGSNNGGERFSGHTRANLKDYIANEKYEVQREKERKQREDEHMAGRFGLDLLGADATEEEMIAYAALLSQESLERDQERQGRKSESPATDCQGSIPTIAEEAVLLKNIAIESGLVATSSTACDNSDPIDVDLAKAIRLSLDQESSYQASAPLHAEHYDIPVRRRANKKSSSNSPSRSTTVATDAGPSPAVALNDLDFALQLSIAEERSRREFEGREGEFPPLSPPGSGKSSPVGSDGKGKGRAS